MQSILEAVNYLLKCFATDQAIDERDGTKIRYTKPDSKKLQQYVEKHIVRSGEVADIYYESTVKEFLSTRSMHPADAVFTTSWGLAPGGLSRHRMPGRLNNGHWKWIPERPADQLPKRL